MSRGNGKDEGGEEDCQEFAEVLEDAFDETDKTISAKCVAVEARFAPITKYAQDKTS